MARRGAPILWTLSGLFLLRVLGQVLVVFLDVSWLPPASEWYSGLLPYPLLLPAQVLILLLMSGVNVQATRGGGFMSVRRARLGRALLAFAALYALVMVIRYVVSGTLHPYRRLLPPGVIPIVFHWVLAAYLATLGWMTLHAGTDRRAVRE